MVVGRVTDPSASFLAGATVHVENNKTGVSVSTSTAQEGDFVVPSLEPGVYRVTVS